MIHIILEKTDIALSLIEDKGYPQGRLKLSGIVDKNKLDLLNKWADSVGGFYCNKYKRTITIPDAKILGVFPVDLSSTKIKKAGFNRAKEEFNVNLELSYDLVRRNSDE